jgi:Mrp family chromosome partitioning ATPase
MQEILNPEKEEPECTPKSEPAACTPKSEPAASAPSLWIDPKVRDELGKLVQKLLSPPNKDARRVVFAGTDSGVGCSWICARAGDILASQVRSSVCVVDCNLRSPGLHCQFAIENHYGLSDALRQPGPIRQYGRQLSRTNLWIVSCGSGTENSRADVASEGMRQRLTELREQFDYVLLDVAPLNICNDAITLGSLSDGVVLVLKANSSRRETARKAVQDLQTANVRIFGAALNQRTFPIPDGIYKRL